MQILKKNLGSCRYLQTIHFRKDSDKYGKGFAFNLYSIKRSLKNSYFPRRHRHANDKEKPRRKRLSEACTEWKTGYEV